MAFERKDKSKSHHKSTKKKSVIGKATDSIGRFLFSEPLDIAHLQKELSCERLTDYLPYRTAEEVEPGFWIYYNEGSVGFCFEHTPLLGASDVEADTLSSAISASIPKGGFVQMIGYGSPRIGGVLQNYIQSRSHPILREMAIFRSRKFVKGAWDGLARNERGDEPIAYYPRYLRHFMAVSMPDEEGLDVLETLLPAMKRIKSAYESMNCGIVSLPPKGLTRFIREILVPKTDSYHDCMELEEGKDLHLHMSDADSLIQSNMHEVNFTTFSTGDFLSNEDGKTKREEFTYRAYELERLPKEFSLGLTAYLIGDPLDNDKRLQGPYLKVLWGKYLGTGESKSKTALHLQQSQNALKLPGSGNLNSVREKNVEWSQVMDEIDMGGRLVKYGYFVITMGKKGMEDTQEEALMRVYRSSGFELRRATALHLTTILSSLPMSLGSGLFEDLERTKRTRSGTSKSFINIAPSQGEYTGQLSPIMLLTGRNGQVMYFDPWGTGSESQGNYNVCIFGKSGAGKSVFMVLLSLGIFANMGDVVVLDDGRSFENVCKLLDGNFVDFNAGEHINFSPFAMLKGAKTEDSQVHGVTQIALILREMAFGADAVRHEAKQVLIALVQEVWNEKKHKGTITDVWNKAKSVKTDLCSEIARGLKPFTENQTYGSYFHGDNFLDVSNPYTVFEMSGIENHGGLRSVLLLSILNLIDGKFNKSKRSKKKALIIDEAWKMLGSENTAEFMSGIARRARKYNGSLINGSQQLDDFINNPGARAAYDNSDWIIQLALADNSVDLLVNSGKLTADAARIRLMKSVHMHSGVYSESMINGPNGSYIGRLALDPFSLAVVTTTGTDVAAQHELQDQGYTLIEAIKIRAGIMEVDAEHILARQLSEAAE